MSCFDGLISIEKCNVSTAVHDLKDIGIDIKFLEQINEKSYGTSLELGLSKIEFARKQMINTLNTNFQEYYRAKTLIENHKIGYSNDNLELKVGGAYYRGIEIMINSKNDFIDLYVSKLRLHIDTTQTTEIKVFDLITGKEINSFNVECVSKEISELQIDETFSAKRNLMRLAFVYDATGIGSYRTDLRNGGCSSCRDYTTMNSFLSSKGINTDIASEITRSDISSISHTSGMFIDYSIQCNREEWLCKFRNLLAIPLLYKSGVELYNHAIQVTSRANNTILSMSLEDMVSMRDEFEFKYRESMENIIKTMNTPTDSRCFTCKKSLVNKVILP